jgi:hypothetical protein
MPVSEGRETTMSDTKSKYKFRPGQRVIVKPGVSERMSGRRGTVVYEETFTGNTFTLTVAFDGDALPNTSYLAEHLQPLDEPPDLATVQRYHEFEEAERARWEAENG